VADALSRQGGSEPIRVKAYQLIMTPDVLKKIKEDQVEAMKEEHLKNERMVGRLEDGWSIGTN
jgi:hypothetical protein